MRQGLLNHPQTSGITPILSFLRKGRRWGCGSSLYQEGFVLYIKDRAATHQTLVMFSTTISVVLLASSACLQLHLTRIICYWHAFLQWGFGYASLLEGLIAANARACVLTAHVYGMFPLMMQRGSLQIQLYIR